jgi:hypothetical protein
MALWKRFWLLLTVIWVVVSGLNAATIIAFAPDEAEKAWRPIALGVIVPAAAYLILWVWYRWRARPRLPK